MSYYQVEFLGRDHPCRDRDASAVRLRTHRDTDYFQFFLALVPGSAMASLDSPPDQDWWRAFVLLAAQQIERLIREGFVPAEDPTMAATFGLRADDAVRASRLPDTLPIFDPSEQYVIGVVVHDFTV